MEKNKPDNVNLDDLSPEELEEQLKKDIAAVDGEETDQKESTISEDQPEEELKKKKTTADRFEKILSDRSEARRQAEEALAEKNRLEKTVEDLKSKVESLEKVRGSSDSDQDDGDTVKKDDSLTLDKIKEIVETHVSTVLSGKQLEELAEKSTAEEIKATSDIPAFVGIKGREDEVRDIMKKHPTLTAAAAYLLIRGIEKSKVSDTESNASKLSVGSRSNSDLLRDKKPSEMTTKELDKEIEKLAATGQLQF